MEEYLAATDGVDEKPGEGHEEEVRCVVSQSEIFRVAD